MAVVVAEVVDLEEAVEVVATDVEAVEDGAVVAAAEDGVDVVVDTVVVADTVVDVVDTEVAATAVAVTEVVDTVVVDTAAVDTAVAVDGEAEDVEVSVSNVLILLFVPCVYEWNS